MFKFIREMCHLRRNNSVIDIELQTEVTIENESESRANILTESPVRSVSHSILVIEDVKHTRSYLEIWLNFFYYLGVTPFRIDYERNIRSFCINKLVSLLIKLLAIVYTIFNIRRVAWKLDQNDRTQQERASACIGLVNQFCSLTLHICFLKMLWFNQKRFRDFFKFLDHTCDNSVSSLGNYLVISVCIVSVFVSLICSVGGLPILGDINAWTFSEILEYNEDVFLLSLKRFDEEYNETILTNMTGIFMDDGHLETIIIGSIGITMKFCQLIDSFLSHDCLLMSTVILWVATQPIRNHLKKWDKGKLDETDSRNLINDLITQHKELNLLSKQINSIANCFLPVLSMTSVITMSYFMHTCAIRDWYFALYLALKLCKVCIAVYFALEISKVAEAFNSWFISERIQTMLQLNAVEFQRLVTEMNQIPFGIGNGVFYIDTRFLLNAFGLTIIINNWATLTTIVFLHCLVYIQVMQFNRERPTWFLLIMFLFSLLFVKMCEGTTKNKRQHIKETSKNSKGHK